MEQWDSALEQRVWNRVLHRQPEGGDFAEMIRLCRHQVQALRFLEPELYRQERLALGLLTALQELITGKPAPVSGGETGGRRRDLSGCLQRCRQQLEGYTAMENHPVCGGVFTALVRQKRAQCARLRQMMQIPPRQTDNRPLL